MTRRAPPAPAAGTPAEYLRRGKVKEVYEISPTELEFRFTNDISVFDKHIPSEIPHKGETLARTASHWFELCGRLKIRHHFLGLSGPAWMRVKRVQVVPKPSTLGPSPKNYLVPLELIVRYYVAGSMWDRVKAGTVRPEELGFAPGTTVQYGQKLPEPHFEVTTKLESIDRLLTIPEALEIAAIDKARLDEIPEMILKIDAAMRREIEPRGLLHVDVEEGVRRRLGRRVLMVVDTFGTADEDRFWDKGAFERGRTVEFSKEFVRQHYRSTGVLRRAHGGPQPRRARAADPPLPRSSSTRSSGSARRSSRG